MPTRTTPWPAGTPCWTDNHVPDLAAARAFYGAVLGWQLDDPDPDAGNFACARSDGRPVAGFLVAVEGARPGWHLFFATEDSAATAAAIERHGGSNLFGPHDVGPDRGRFQLAADPSGAVFGVWQAGSLTGTGVYGEHGSLGWEELRSTRPTDAQAFYAVVFGLTMRPLDGTGPEYVLFHLPDGSPAPLGGMGPLGGAGDGADTAGDEAGDMVGDEASRWEPYFVVDDVDTALDEGTGSGGSVASPARDTPWGRMALLADPFGARFWVMTPVGPTPER